jgi:hypothetical protein
MIIFELVLKLEIISYYRVMITWEDLGFFQWICFEDYIFLHGEINI